MHSAAEFTVIATGQIESCEIPGVDNAYCKWGTVLGEDWTVLNALTEGITQVARRGRGADPALVWNFPLDMTLKSQNAFGWPKLHFTVYGLDAFGTDVVQGYGFTHLPCSPGRYKLTVHLFKPKSRSGLLSFMSWIKRKPPQFLHSDFVCESEGREVTTVTSGGTITVALQIVSKDMAATGYDDGASQPSAVVSM